LKKKPKSILITGGNSTVGRDLINFFLKDNFNVIAILRKKTKKKIYNKNYKEIYFDFSKPKKIREKIDFVLNTIATHEYSANKKLDNYYTSNIKCIKNIVELCQEKKVSYLINLSTISIYKKKNSEIKETNVIDDESILGSSKYIGEKIIEMNDLNFVNLRLPGVLTLDNNLISRPWLKKIIFLIKEKKKIEIFNQNMKFNSIIDTLEIFNFLKFIFYKKKKIKGTYNLSASKPIKLKQILKIITKFYDYNLKIKFKSVKKYNSSLINLKKIKIDSNYKITSTKNLLARYLKTIN
tara:strand:+ start:1407 stop:2291 length:885 start_codon:yes stop_codon:yes gene_type:complete